MSRMVHIEGADDYYISAAYEESALASAVPGKVYDACAFNNSGATAYLMLIDKATAAAGGDLPCVAPVPVLAGTQGWYSSTLGKRMKRGICIVLSTTPHQYTAGVGANGWLEVNFRSR